MRICSYAVDTPPRLALNPIEGVCIRVAEIEMATWSSAGMLDVDKNWAQPAAPGRNAMVEYAIRGRMPRHVRHVSCGSKIVRAYVMLGYEAIKSRLWSARRRK